MIERHIWVLFLVLVFVACSGDEEVEQSLTEPNASTEQTDEPEPVDPGEQEPSNPFSEGPYGVKFRDTVGDIEASTLDGATFSLRELWTGEDSFIFLFFTDNPEQSADLVSFLGDLWFPGGTSAGSLAELIAASPENVHYVMGSFDTDASDDMARMQAGLNTALSSLAPDIEEQWRSRFHFLSETVWQTPGWLGEVFSQSGWLWFGVDRHQKMRQLGMPSDVGTGAAKLKFFTHEVRYFNFEAEREARLSAETDVTVIPVFENQSVKNDKVDVVFPTADVMSQFDTMEIDVSNFCPDHLDENCGKWDYKSMLHICDSPTSANENTETACQPRVVAVEAVDEVLGVCAGTELTCVSDADCDEGLVCEGYVATVEGVEGIDADTLACSCESPLGELREAVQGCNDEGTGYNDCNCACNTEMARWITTYGREGRWVTDVSPFLAFFKDGGTHKLRMQSGNRYDFDFYIRLSNRNDGPTPRAVQFLYSGKGFNENYNVDREPIVFESVAGTERVQLVAYITGHGWGAEVENCAEFCNHTHHFRVNGTEYVKEHPTAGQSQGCVDQIEDGVVPNQYGTWPYGRAGWCPGLDVKPWVVDVTDALVSGENTITYEGLFNGATYVPTPSNSGQGFGANITMSSYLVSWN